MLVGDSKIYMLEQGYYKIDVTTGRFLDLNGEDCYCTAAHLNFVDGEFNYRFSIGDDVSIDGYVKLLDIQGYDFYFDCRYVINVDNHTVVKGNDFSRSYPAVMKSMQCFDVDHKETEEDESLAQLLKELIREQKETNRLLESIIRSR